jgi:predicted flavoprotein YhiN
MIEVTQEPDGSMTIDWDPNDPVESIMNDWTEEDFIQAIKEHLEKEEKNKIMG